eukprot:2240042-Amphidinium_carterae.1
MVRHLETQRRALEDRLGKSLTKANDSSDDEHRFGHGDGPVKKGNSGSSTSAASADGNLGTLDVS